LINASEGVHPLSLPLSLVLLVVNVTLSRWLTPGFVVNANEEVTYLNINLSHEPWKDVNIDFFAINYDNPPALLYLFRYFWRVQVVQLPVSGLLFFLSRWFYADVPVC
jgi:hypothetical protein